MIPGTRATRRPPPQLVRRDRTKGESAMQVSVQGTINPDGTLECVNPLPLPRGRVLGIAAALPEPDADDPIWKRMQAIWNDQKAHGHAPRDIEEVEAEGGAVRAEWDERM